MSDVWSTMAGECGQGDGLHLTTGDHALLEVIDPETAEPLPLDDGVTGELVWTHLNRKASPLLRYRSSDLATVWTAPCACGRTTPRIRIGGRRDDMLRVQAVNVYPQAIGELLGGARHAVVAEGDPIVPPLHVYVEGTGRRGAPQGRPAHRCRGARAHTWQPAGGRAQDGESLPNRPGRQTAGRDQTPQRRAMSVTVEELGTARIISWDNQRHRNAWGRETIAAIADALDATGREPGVRCLVARGAGADFSAGDDLFEAAESDVDGFAATIDEFQRLTQVVLESLVPVIAAIDGVCIGGALEFAASCDLRIGTHRSRYATPEVRIGLGASNAGTLLLPEVLGESAARELLLTGQLKTAGWMNRHGFFNDVVDDIDAGIADWARVFDQAVPTAVARTKRMLNDRFGDLLPEAMARETQTCVDLFPTEEAQEAVQRFARKD